MEKVALQTYIRVMLSDISKKRARLGQFALRRCLLQVNVDYPK